MNITASLQIKNNIYQVVLNYKDINGKRKQKWVSTGLSQKGNNKRLANQKIVSLRAGYFILLKFLLYLYIRICKVGDF